MILPTYVEHSFFKHLAPFISPCCVRVRSVFRSLFITAPSKPPGLITVTYTPSDPSPTPPFQLAAAGEVSRENRKGVGKTSHAASPRLFTSPRSCHEAAVRAASPAGEEGSRARRDVPPPPFNGDPASIPFEFCAILFFFPWRFRRGLKIKT